MNRVKSVIPNSLTSANILCGCIGIVLVFDNQLLWGSAMIWLAALFDFLDGFTARLLKVNSKLGKELDSLADMITFGVLPSMIIFSLMNKYPLSEWVVLSDFLPYIAFFIAVFSALRLAKFNIDTRQSDTFIGLPTPANAICVSAFPYILEQYDISPMIINISLITYSLVFSWLLVSENRMLALKFINYGWYGNEVKWIFIVFSLVSIVALQVVAIPIIIACYIITSLVNNVFIFKNEQNKGHL